MSQPTPFEAASNVLHRLYDAFDRHDDECATHCFAPDATWQRLDGKLQGHQEIASALGRRSKTMLVHHVATNLLLVRADETTALIHFYLTVYRHDSGEITRPPAPLLGPLSIGRGRAEFRAMNNQWVVSFLGMDVPTLLAKTN